MKRKTVLKRKAGKRRLTKSWDIARDYRVKALPAGTRISKNGKRYYENRVNRSDNKLRL